MLINILLIETESVVLFKVRRVTAARFIAHSTLFRDLIELILPRSTCWKRNCVQAVFSRCPFWKDLTQEQSINPFIPAQKYEKLLKL